MTLLFPPIFPIQHIDFPFSLVNIQYLSYTLLSTNGRVNIQIDQGCPDHNSGKPIQYPVGKVAWGEYNGMPGYTTGVKPNSSK